MDKIIVNRNFINNLKIHSMNNNSNIFVKDDDLIKMPKIWEDNSNLKKIILGDMEKNIEVISNIEGNNYVLPKYSIYTSRVATPNYKGYGMDFFKDYQNLSEIIGKNEYSFKDRMDLCKTLCDAIIKLEKYKVAYWDLHSDNILIKDKNIKICDMDSIISAFVSGYIEYKRTLMTSYKYLSLLLLSILYGINDIDLYNMIKEKRNAKFIKESKIFKRVIDKNYYIFYPDKYLDLFTEDYVENTKLILKR